MYFESLKVLRQRTVRILIVIVVLASFIQAVLKINNFTKYQDGKTLKGIEAVNSERKLYSNIDKKLDVDNLNRALSLYKKTNKDTDCYYKIDDKYPGYLDLLIRAYSPAKTFEPGSLLKIKNADNFYKRRVELVAEYLKLYETGEVFKEFEVPEILRRAEKINKPFNYGFSLYWDYLFGFLSVIYIFCVILALRLSTGIFTSEKESGMLSVIKGLSRRTFFNVIRNKFLSCFIILITTAIISIAISSIITFIIFGFDSAIQLQANIKYFLSIADLTFFEAYIVNIAIFLISITATICIGGFISYFSKDGISSFITGCIIMFAPLLLARLPIIPLSFRKFFALMPINALLFDMNLISQQIYSLFSYKLLLWQAMLIFNMMIIFLSLLVYIYERNKKGKVIKKA